MSDDRLARALILAHRAFADTLERELSVEAANDNAPAAPPLPVPVSRPRRKAVQRPPSPPTPPTELDRKRARADLERLGHRPRRSPA